MVAPTVLVEPEKAEEAGVEGEAPAEGVEGADQETSGTEEGKDKAAKPSDDKTKTAPEGKDKETKFSDDKGKTSKVNKEQPGKKETKKK